MYNDLDNFEGTWELNTASLSFKLVLIKKIMIIASTPNVSWYEDAIVGEYLIIKDGDETVNTLLNLSIQHPNWNSYNVHGGLISKPTDYGCFGCGPNDMRLSTSFNDVTCQNNGITIYMSLRKFNDNGTDKLECTFHPRGMSWGEDPPCNYAIPILETYILTKVE
jgi:hypothetical protein